jgi:hypothetical protein
MKIDIYIKFTGIDKYGNIIAERKEEKANSCVKAFIAWLSTQATNTSASTVPDTGGTNRTMPVSSWIGNGNPAVGNSNAGILAGTGTNAVTINDINLQTKIVHGTSAGQLEYSAESTSSAWTVSGSDAYFSRQRTLANNSGGNITINEVGYVTNYSGGLTFLLERTLPTPYTVNNGTGVIITYKWQVSV